MLGKTEGGGWLVFYLLSSSQYWLEFKLVLISISV